MKSESITFLKEDVLALGQMVDRTIEEVARLLKGEAEPDISIIEEREELINDTCQNIEEKCLDLLLEQDVVDAREVRTLVSSTIIAAKFERIADHANRVARLAAWANEDKIAIPPQLVEMALVIHRMVQDVLLCFVADDEKKAQEVVLKDSQVDYLHDLLSKQLLSDLGAQDPAAAQMKAQFLFCARFLERMGDACVSVARRVFFIATGNRLKKELGKVG